MKGIREHIQDVDLFLEVRDARVPYASKNSDFDAILREYNKPKFILFNKFDLCDQKKTLECLRAMNKVGIHNTAMSAVLGENVAQILKFAKNNVKLKYSSVGFWMMIGGCPNVGKSTIVNQLRKRSQTLSKKDISPTSPLPCHTKHVKSFKFNENPLAYLIDTPGVMMPTITDDEQGLKLGLVGCIKDRIVGKDILVDYLVWMLNKIESRKYWKVYGLEKEAASGQELVTHALKKFHHSDVEVTYDLILRHFRQGELGKFTLDNVDEFIAANG
jgi:ribosome biogenesis GTPase A